MKPQKCFPSFSGQVCQHTSVSRFHYHYGNVLLPEDFILFPGRSMEPVVIIQLNLYKIPGVTGQNPAQRLRGAMKGKSEILDFSHLLLLQKVFRRSMIEIVGNQLIRYAMQQIKVNGIQLQTGKLVLELLFKIRFRLHIKFVRHEIGFPGVFLQRSAKEGLRLSSMVNVSSVVIIDAMRHTVINQFFRGCPVNGFRKSLFRLRKAHRPHTKL